MTAVWTDRCFIFVSNNFYKKEGIELDEVMGVLQKHNSFETVQFKWNSIHK